MTFQNHWLIITQITQIKRQLDARIICSFHRHYLHLQFESLPPCEASFVQHVLRASLQTYIWMKSDTAQQPEKSALDFGWEDQNGLSPVYFVGNDFRCTLREIIEVLELF
jgi:hypothetical protein